MKSFKIILFITLSINSSLSNAEEITGSITDLLYIDLIKPKTYPSKKILGSFGSKVVSEYSIGVATHKRSNAKFLNFYTFPNNVTNKMVVLRFTVEYYDSEGNKLGESKIDSTNPIPPTNPNLRPSTLYGSSVKESDFSRVKQYKITYIEKQI